MRIKRSADAFIAVKEEELGKRKLLDREQSSWGKQDLMMGALGSVSHIVFLIYIHTYWVCHTVPLSGT